MAEPAGWQLRERGGIRWFEATPAPGVRLAFVTRHGGASVGEFGTLNLSSEVGDDPSSVNENHRRVSAALDLEEVVTVRQVHAADVIEVESGPLMAGAGDALWCRRRPRALGITAADCLPVFVYERKGAAAGIAHCGWRGTALALAARLARALAGALDISYSRLGFACGPCICPGCYPVGEDVQKRLRDELGDQDRFITPGPGGWRLDLRAACRSQLLELGLAESPGLRLCTREHPELCYSVRLAPRTGRNLAVIELL